MCHGEISSEATIIAVWWSRHCGQGFLAQFLNLGRCFSTAACPCLSIRRNRFSSVWRRPVVKMDSHAAVNPKKAQVSCAEEIASQKQHP
jgi:hypothetical protein